MKIKELNVKTEKELKTTLSEKRVALHNFRFGVAGAKNRNVKLGKLLKKDIARIMTIQNRKIVASPATRRGGGKK